MNLGHQLFTGNASSLAKKELGKEFTGYIYYREASNQVVEGFPFYFFPFFFFIHVCFSVFFFCFAGTVNMEASKLSSRFKFFLTTLS